ncbi:Fur family transcriptional regulator [Pseudorhodoferax sp.]|uniref:Fur family transcriptional regulator n=1 Tax=Pseudorhodoferax sp. TaxID=1993553 RepID=UPI002DD6B4F3|nr:transcriptional repressor [Pseudorhodoferax sp.]
MTSTVLQRLRAARLQPTVARIGLLQVLEAAAPHCLSAEDLFQQMLRRGTRVSVGTVYRVVQQLHAAGLLVHEWDLQRRALYGVKPEGFDGQAVRLVCRDTGRTVTLADEELHARLLAAAARQGQDLRGQALTVVVDSLVPVPDARPARPLQRPRLVA